MNLVTLHHVGVAYDGYEALKNVDLTIAQDDFLGIIGPNGGGKTTLVKAILGTVPHTGEVVLAPELFRGKERLIGYMPQISNFDRTFPISVLEVVLSGLQGHRGFVSRYTKEDRAKSPRAARNIGDRGDGTQPHRRGFGRADAAGATVQGGDFRPEAADTGRAWRISWTTNSKTNFTGALRELNGRMGERHGTHRTSGTITSVVKEIVCVNRRVHRHHSNVITEEQLRNYDCPIQIVSHGHIPHTVLEHHPGDCCCDHD